MSEPVAKSWQIFWEVYVSQLQLLEQRRRVHPLGLQANFSGYKLRDETSTPFILRARFWNGFYSEFWLQKILVSALYFIWFGNTFNQWAICRTFLAFLGHIPPQVILMKMSPFWEDIPTGRRKVSLLLVSRFHDLLKRLTVSIFFFRFSENHQCVLWRMNDVSEASLSSPKSLHCQLWCVEDLMLPFLGVTVQTRKLEQLLWDDYIHRGFGAIVANIDAGSAGGTLSN